MTEGTLEESFSPTLHAHSIKYRQLLWLKIRRKPSISLKFYTRACIWVLSASEADFWVRYVMVKLSLMLRQDCSSAASKYLPIYSLLNKSMRSGNFDTAICLEKHSTKSKSLSLFSIAHYDSLLWLAVVIPSRSAIRHLLSPAVSMSLARVSLERDGRRNSFARYASVV